MHKAIRSALESEQIEFREVLHTALPVPVKGPVDVAIALQWPLERIAKTLVLQAGQPCFAVLSANKRLQFAAISGAMGTRCRAATREEVQQLLEYPPGSISPLGVAGWPVFLDSGLAAFDSILVGGGGAGSEVELKVSDFVRITHAVTLDLSEPG